jgi:hypothetical protein
LFLKRGGRLGFVLPAELLSVNYAAPVRRYLFSRFRDVQLVLFDEQVFPDAEADVVLLLADGYLEGPADHARIRQARNAETLISLGIGQAWIPVDPSAKWTSSLVRNDAVELLTSLQKDGYFGNLETWGDTTLGMVTGNNKYFTLSPARAKELGLSSAELRPLSPPGSSHLRRLAFTGPMLARLGKEGSAVHLFYPNDPPSPEASTYIFHGHRTGVDTAYKCRTRRTWYRVPLIPPADLLLTYMNADTPRLTSNDVAAYHLNSVHGVYLRDELRQLGRELLPLASLNSATMLHAELVGRAYGGGVLKIEPTEADVWGVPSPQLVLNRASQLNDVKPMVARLLADKDMMAAAYVVDRVLLHDGGLLSIKQLERIRLAREELANRRSARALGGG